jgi:DNA-binding transcriptional regulator YdaS (Cro superfamily)
MDQPITPQQALVAATKAVGGQSALARLCRRTQPTIWKWLHGEQGLPAEHVLTVEAATGIARHLLRPDIYPADLGPSPAWKGVEQGAQAVAFNSRTALQGCAA